MFCKKCGSILVPKKEGGKTVLRCSCGYVSSETSAAKITESAAKIPNKEERLFEPAAEDKITAPITEIECPKCLNGKAYYWTRQTRAGDEGETKFHQCTKCKHKWREYV
ncbi:MAG TPA: transcription factor S [Candidatus Nanoarchaeia archaeon]|nr:transcription factor S [Candidatus Nanoarchaeia archaeon]